jgi:hypothetical protein
LAISKNEFCKYGDFGAFVFFFVSPKIPEEKTKNKSTLVLIHQPFQIPGFDFLLEKSGQETKSGRASFVVVIQSFFQPRVLIRHFARTNLDQKLSSSSQQLSSPSLLLGEKILWCFGFSKPLTRKICNPSSLS